MPTRVPIWKGVLAIAIAACALARFKLSSELKFRTFSFGWNTSILPVGERVFSIVDIRVDDVSVPAGTLCLVVSDPPDEDSANPDRTVVVRTSGRGQHGPIFAVKRIQLRIK